MTAVEWLEEQTRKPEWNSLKRGDIIEQAKEMEQQQQGYSKEELLEHLNNLIVMQSSKLDTFTDEDGMVTKKWFEQFKNK